jgi:hypothetical protein
MNPWHDTTLYFFKNNGTDAGGPVGDIVFDQSGAIYGATEFLGGNCTGCGGVYKLTPMPMPPWTETLLYSFSNAPGSLYHTYASPIFDLAGNLYGPAYFGPDTGCLGSGCGGIYKLTPAGPPWIETDLYDFAGMSGQPVGGLIFDASGNLYGTTSQWNNGVRTVFQLSPNGTGWTFTVLHRFSGGQGCGPAWSLTMDRW